MRAFVYKADGKHGGFVNFTMAPANRTQQARFGVSDVVIAAILLALVLGTAAILRLVLAS